MPATIIDGKAVAQRVLQQLATRVQALKERGVAPRLAVVRVGDDPASKVYIRAKIRACEQVGMLGGEFELPGDSTEFSFHCPRESVLTGWPIISRLTRTSTDCMSRI
jgi:methylenetetrahydrofolate dehydrogenase (NADP+)/methenyltetrahydrofolate cyclohydrolase